MSNIIYGLQHQRYESRLAERTIFCMNPRVLAQGSNRSPRALKSWGLRNQHAKPYMVTWLSQGESGWSNSDRSYT